MKEKDSMEVWLTLEDDGAYTRPAGTRPHHAPKQATIAAILKIKRRKSPLGLKKPPVVMAPLQCPTLSKAGTTEVLKIIQVIMFHGQSVSFSSKIRQYTQWLETIKVVSRRRKEELRELWRKKREREQCKLGRKAAEKTLDSVVGMHLVLPLKEEIMRTELGIQQRVKWKLVRFSQ